VTIDPEDWLEERWAVCWVSRLARISPILGRMKMSSESKQAEVFFEGGIVSYRSSGQDIWAIPFVEIKVIGELTLPADLFRDDYFLVLVGADDWFSLPLDTSGIELVTEKMSAVLEHEFQLSLAGEVDLRSCVIWPSALAGESLFDYKPVETGGLRRVVEKLVGSGQVELVLAPVVQAALT